MLFFGYKTASYDFILDRLIALDLRHDISSQTIYICKYQIDPLKNKSGTVLKY